MTRTRPPTSLAPPDLIEEARLPTNPSPDRLLTAAEAAEVLGTLDTSGERFPRRLIAERRIRFTRVGRHVRIPESALREFIEAGMVEPVTRLPRRRRRAA
jgi:excisionase family DNA binding protein